MLFGMAFALLPWAVRNHRVTGGRLVVTTLWVGPSLYDGLNSEANGESDMAFFQRVQLRDGKSEYEVDRHYRRKAWKFASDEPARAAELAVIKLARFWSPWPNASQFRQWWVVAITATVFGLTVIPAAWGAWLMRRRFRVLLLTVGPVLYFSAIHSVFVGSVRYRLPAEYPLSVLTAVGVVALFRRLREFSKPEHS